MANEAQRQARPETPREPGRRVEELDRQPGSNRGTKGQMRESRRVARSSEDDIQTMAGHDDPDKSDLTEK
jgi:hypothetical protein